MEFDPYNSLIKDIYIHLPNFKFRDSTTSDLKDLSFVGRENVIKRIVNCLNDGSKSGAYLITGYRGVGKSTLVHRAISIARKERKNKEINISLAQTGVNEMDILRQLCRNILNYYESKGLVIWLRKFSSIYFLLPTTLTFILLLIPLFQNYYSYKDSNICWKYNSYLFDFVNSIFFSYDTTRLLFFLLIGLGLSVIFSKIIFHFGLKRYQSIIKLIDRMSAEVSHESENFHNSNNVLLNFIGKNTTKYEIMTAKEVEYEISKIINKESNKNLIFVFDELDKLGSEISGFDQLNDNLSQNENGLKYDNFSSDRKRKELVIKILGNFKYLITTTKAKFIFIAGREMFDVSLADISDRNSVITSIFTKIIYVDSLNKDNNIVKKSSEKVNEEFSELIEEYLFRIIFPYKIYKNYYEKSEYGLKVNKYLYTSYYELIHIQRKNYELKNKKKNYLDNFFLIFKQKERPNKKEYEKKDNIALQRDLKIIMSLKALSNYITYRSHGSPKKMISTLESFIVKNVNIIEELKSKRSALFNDKKRIIGIDLNFFTDLLRCW